MQIIGSFIDASVWNFEMVQIRLSVYRKFDQISKWLVYWHYCFWLTRMCLILGLCLLTTKQSYNQISRNFKTTRHGVSVIGPLCNSTGILKRGYGTLNNESTLWMLIAWIFSTSLQLITPSGVSSFQWFKFFYDDGFRLPAPSQC